LSAETLGAPPGGRLALADWLAAEGAPWQLDFARWPQAQALRWRAVLAASAVDRLVLLADRECDALLLQSVEARLQRAVRWVVCDAAAVDHWLGAGEADFRALAQVDDSPADNAVAAVDDLSALRLSAEASPVVRLLDADALRRAAGRRQRRAHRVHRAGPSIRFRIDGVMSPMRRIDGVALAEQLVSRLKVMAELDIGERRLPQDGRFKLRVQGRVVDFRLSIMPTGFGEDAVVRVLDRSRIDQAPGGRSRSKRWASTPPTAPPCAPWRSCRTACCSSPGPPAAARRPRCTRCSPRFTPAAKRSSPSKTRSSTSWPA
jgi:general secretion pathway protein E